MTSIEDVNEVLRELIPGLVIVKNLEGGYTYEIRDDALKLIAEYQGDRQLPWIRNLIFKVQEAIIKGEATMIRTLYTKRTPIDRESGELSKGPIMIAKHNTSDPDRFLDYFRRLNPGSKVDEITKEEYEALLTSDAPTDARPGEAHD